MRLLVPLDGSTRAEYALGPAALLARGLGTDASVHLLRVVALTPTAMAETFPRDYERLVALAYEAAEDYLREVTLRPSLEGLHVACHVRAGPPEHSICAFAHEQADLVVISSHGRSGLLQLALGSVAEAIARTSTVPTLIFHVEDIAHTGATLPTPLVLLVALDGSPFAETALPPAMTVARALHAEIMLLRVIHSSTADARADRADIDAARGYLETVQHQIIAQGIAAQTSVAMGDPAFQILQVARRERHPADIVALTTHSRTGLDRVFLGSVAEQVLHTLHRPLLLVHPPEQSPT
jgi:nucleotide-binding universal stress UspA family protein